MKKLANLLVEIEIWPMAILTLASMFQSNIQPYVLTVALVYWLLRKFTLGYWSRRTPIDWPIAIIMMLLPVSLWASFAPERTSLQIMRLLVGIAVYYSLANWTNRVSRLKVILHGLILGGLSLSILAPFVVEWNVMKIPFLSTNLSSNFTLLTSDPVNPNVLAGGLVLLLPFGLSLILFAWSKLSWVDRVLAVAFLFLGLSILILTQSRSAWISFLVSTAIVTLFRLKKPSIVLIVLIIGITIAAIISFSGLSTLMNYNPTLGGLEGRYEVWSRAWFMIQDFPFTGIGMGNFTEVADRLYPFFLFAPGSVEHAHNLFLQVAVDLGLIGLIAWLAAQIAIGFAVFRRFMQSKPLDEAIIRCAAVGVIASQSALLVHGLTDSVTWGMVRSAPLAWVVMGVGAAVVLNRVKVQNKD